jgi:hypothetical protein
LSSKDQQIQNLKNEIEFLKGQLSNRNKKIFGTSSEQVDANQLSLFNEAEKFSDSKVEEHVIYSYVCKSCEKEIGESNIVSTQMPQTIFYNSMASNELIAHTLILKYQHAMPLYRQESYFDMWCAVIINMDNFTYQE